MKILRVITIVLMIFSTIHAIKLFTTHIQYAPSNLGTPGYLGIFVGSFIIPTALFFLVRYLSKKIAEEENKQ